MQVLGDGKTFVFNISQGAASEIESLPEQLLANQISSASPLPAQAVIEDEQTTPSLVLKSSQTVYWQHIIVILCVTVCIGVMIIVITALYINCRCHKKSYNLWVSILYRCGLL